MRLTLRTLLAYLDDILDREDAEELAKKIEESEVASNLVHRIRSSTRRLRLGAPKLSGKGMGLDPNTVAEYLDNTLPQDRIRDFEEVCLESDVHLAEVAACHQILTLVLGGVADVDPALRERIYRLGAEVEPPLPADGPDGDGPDGDGPNGDGAAAATAAGLVASGADAAATVSREAVTESTESEPDSAVEDVAASDVAAPEVAAPAVAAPPVQAEASKPSARREPSRGLPEDAGHPELKFPTAAAYGDSRKRWISLGITASVVILLAAFALVAVGPLDATHPVLGWMFSRPEVAARTDDDVDDPALPSPSPGDRENPLPPGDADLAGGPGGEPALAGGLANQANDQQPLLDEPQPGGAETGGTPRSPSRQPESPQSVSPMTETPAAGSPASELPAEKGLDTEREAGGPTGIPAVRPPRGAGEEAGEPAGRNEPEAPGGPDVPPEGLPPFPADDAAGPAENATEVPRDQAPPLGGPEAGRFTSADQVLSRFDSSLNAYVRLAPLSNLNSGDRLLALPTFRPQMLMSPGIQVILVGPTQVVPYARDNREGVDLAVQYGRAVLLTDGKDNVPFRLQLGTQRWTLTFVDAASTAAIQVRRFLPPGSNPEEAQALNVVRVIAAGGPLVLRDSAGKETTVDPMWSALLVDQSEPILAQVEQSPSWIDGSDVSLLDRGASKELEQQVAVDRPLELSLHELSGHRRVEVRTLAVRCLGYLDLFDPFLDALNDRNLKAYWSFLEETLEDAVARSPETAARVRQTFERLRGEEADKLYRMLWGFSDQQLRTGAAAELVQYLRSPSMDVRVLAFLTLTRITERTHLYRPERDPEQQKASLVDWQRTLEEGAIEHRELPYPADLKPFVGPAASEETAEEESASGN